VRARTLHTQILLNGMILLDGTTVAAAAQPAEGGEAPVARVSAPHRQLTAVRAEAAPSAAPQPDSGADTDSGAPRTDAVSGEARQAAGAVAAWGENFNGQLGQIFRDPWEVSPVGVEGLSEAVQLAGTGSFNLALLSNGTVVSWGGNKSGQLGDDLHRASWEQGAGEVVVQEEDPTTHQVLGPLHGVEQVAAATHHAIVLMQDGTVMTWGGDLHGEMGNGTHGWERALNVNMRLPKRVPGLSGITAVAAAGGSDYALTEAGTVMAWGNDTEGQLGIGEPGPERCETEVAHNGRYQLCSSHPLPVVWHNPQTGQQEALREVTAIAGGGFAAYAILRDGRVVSWGSNRHGQLGTGAATYHSRENAPAEVRLRNGSPLTGVAELAVGTGFVLARTQEGGVLGWGSAEHSALTGIGTEDCGREVTGRKPRRHEPKPCVKLPTPVPALEALHPEALSAGHFYGLALAHGSVYAWGEDERGQLGSGRPAANGTARNTAGNPEPTRVEGVGTATAVDAALNHSLALLAPGVAPPPPLVTAHAEPQALEISWQSVTSNGREQVLPERLLYRERLPEGEDEPAEQGRDESEEGAPVNLETNPVYVQLRGERLEGQPIVAGQVLSVQPGEWSGGRPITFAYSWQRCSSSGEDCVTVPSKRYGGYRTTAADVGSTLRAVVTATGPEGSEVAYTATTGIVLAAAEEETGRTAATRAPLAPGTSSYAIRGWVEKVPDGRKAPLEVLQPLQPSPYAVRFQAGGRTRLMVLTPLP
jgi:alpha-tubulin suppressor-like RCC1 family protein